MPLILLTGYPCTGKTTVARELVALLQKRLESDPQLAKKNYNIIYHSDKSLGIKHSDYISSKNERKLRSEIISAVKRDLTKTNIVIVDSLNYIKGFRYQLHCEVKNVSTTYCLIQTMCPVDQILEWNQQRGEPEDVWDRELLDQLIQRYEEPNAQTRWDSPLFPVLTTQDSISDFIDDITVAVFNRAANSRDSLSKALQKPNSATILKPASQTNFIQKLDSETTLVVKKIMNHIKTLQSIGNSNCSARVIVSEGVTDINDDNCFYVDLPTISISLPHLQRLKRQFVTLNKLRDMDEKRIVPLFADYLSKNLND
ncbi:hypothetical protein HG535_0D03230 [Zygotorulaspora mrakii]|uniref:Protein KTI12 n=1 Tax=Zygotorulaspora mrakii TaxID=42260 RepID=A0A7H9B1S9_ZYGMR|nr:uncharacterized protein HG535_0D03230 [Zygotorulaspora mrakii]QLG72615.1 hypothetical protein HG535_0D03230 [Zygotorulaspora mrakii]